MTEEGRVLGRAGESAGKRDAYKQVSAWRGQV